MDGDRAAQPHDIRLEVWDTRWRDGERRTLACLLVQVRAALALPARNAPPTLQGSQSALPATEAGRRLF